MTSRNEQNESLPLAEICNLVTSQITPRLLRAHFPDLVTMQVQNRLNFIENYEFFLKFLAKHINHLLRKPPASFLGF